MCVRIVQWRGAVHKDLDRRFLETKWCRFDPQMKDEDLVLEKMTYWTENRQRFEVRCVVI